MNGEQLYYQIGSCSSSLVVWFFSSLNARTVANPFAIVGHLRVHSRVRVDGARFHAPRHNAHLDAVQQQRTARVALFRTQHKT